MNSVPPLRIEAINDAETSENRIHSDDIARRFGFSAALVSGVNVFGYLSQPLVAHYGESWLTRGQMAVKFIKPAYPGDELQISTSDVNNSPRHRHHLTLAHNADGALLAQLESRLPDELPEISPLAFARAEDHPPSPRVEIHWDLINLQETQADYLWQPSLAENAERVAVQRDPSPLYTGPEPFIHPYFLLDACNKALMRMFILPAWIHTGSRLTLRQGLRIGQAITVRTTPVKKWEQKGHQFVTLYIAMLVDETVALEAEHTAIFRLSDR